MMDFHRDGRKEWIVLHSHLYYLNLDEYKCGMVPTLIYSESLQRLVEKVHVYGTKYH